MLKSFVIQIQAAADPQSTLSVSFEHVLSQLEPLPRMFIEWDGSFVWRGECPATAANEAESWQLDGMIYDHLGSVRYLELKGTCSLESWQKLISVLGWPEQSLTIHRVHEGRFESPEAFASSIFH